ncbi:MAG TPA: ATP-binding protein [Flavobacteriales bacterium]|nr:ATP-binding protein [Flavobacteriales bacterium]
MCANYEINEDHYGNILISLTEAVNNAIQHGNKNDPKKNVEIVFDVETNLESFSFTVKDEGDGFDYTTIPDPTAPENIEKISGRGVFLMRNLADKVGFYSEGREIQLNFKISPN